MTIHGALRTEREEKLAKDPSAAVNGSGFYDACFLGSLEPALPWLEKNEVKLAVNAGASDAEMLAKEVKRRVAELGLDLKVAWIEGDEVTAQMRELQKGGERITNLDTGRDLADWGHEPVCAQCYLGGMGIAEAFRAGADIIICGRVADAGTCCSTPASTVPCLL